MLDNVATGPTYALVSMQPKLELLSRLSGSGEAVRLGTMADESHRRLGLMLLDSAAEVMMHRECRLRA